LKLDRAEEVDQPSDAGKIRSQIIAHMLEVIKDGNWTKLLV